MSEDVILDVTEEFIRSSETNLNLALQVERAMPYVRQHLVGVALDAVEKCFPRAEWGIERSVMDVMAKGANLVLRRKVWTVNHSAADIWLWTEKPSWKSVEIGLYFTGPFSQEVQLIKEKVVPLTSTGFNFDDSEDEQPGVRKFLDAELRDWSSERFLIRLLEDEDGPDRIATEISSELNSIDEFVQSSELISLF